MNRKELIETLDLVRHGCEHAHPSIPVFSNFMFDNDVVIGSRDGFAVMAPCKAGMSFGVHAKTLLDLLKNTHVNDINFEMDDENVLMKAGRSRIKLPFNLKDDYPFIEPEDEKWKVILEIDEHTLEGLELCLTTASNDSVMAGFMGITLVGGNPVYLYSSDGDSISRYKLSIEPLDDDIYITMPVDFCQQILRVAETTQCKAGSIFLNNEMAVAEFGNDYKIISSVIQVDNPADFDGEINKAMNAEPKFMEAPKGFHHALNRARVLAEAEGRPTVIKVDGNKMRMVTETHMGVVRDSLKVKGDHKAIEVSVAPHLVYRAINLCDEFALFEGCTVYRKGSELLQLIANLEE